MPRKKKENIEGIIEIERLENKRTNKSHNVSEEFYYLLGIVIGMILIFATEEFLSTINYLFVVIFAVIAVIKMINFIMEKEYLRKDYGDMIMSVMCAWLAIFVFKYGQYIFLEMVPILVSLLLFTMGISSLTKYFDYKRKGNQVMGIGSLLLGVLLITLPGSTMYIFFKITGVYLLITIILDLIDTKIRTYK